jgi:DNA-binding NtrC family response regulator
MAIKLIQDSLVMSPSERGNANILLIEPDPVERNNFRTAIKQLGFGGMSDCPNHMSAFEKLEQRHFSHVIFAARDTNMPVKEFLKKVIEGKPGMICIPASNQPSVDEVFDLLIMGAKGYLVKPFTIDSLDVAIVNATKGEPMSEAVLKAKDRNGALVAIMMHSLDKYATTMRQAQQFETAARELPKNLSSFRRAAELAATFAKDGSDGLLASIEEFCVERSKGPASRLGRLRKRLQNKRED